MNNLSNSNSLYLSEEHSQTLPREFPRNSVETPTSSTGTGTLQPIRHTFVPSNRREPSEDQGSQDPDFRPKRTMLFSIGSNTSNNRLHNFANVVRKRVSRESEASKGSSKKGSKPSLKEEDLARRRELRRALHRRLEEELLWKSEYGYDTDAIPTIYFPSALSGNDDSNQGHVGQASLPLPATGPQCPRYLPVGVSVRIPRIPMMNGAKFKS